MKKCTRCGVLRPYNDFVKNKNKKDGYHHVCKICRRKYLEENKEVISKQRAGYRASRKEKTRKYNNKYYCEHREEICEKHSIRNAMPKTRKIVRKYENRKYKQNMQYRVGKILRSRVTGAIRNKRKVGSAVKDLGCPVDELIEYLEEKFYPNPETGDPMTWDNWGKFGWHIDHIIPLSSFDLEDRAQFLVACHYTNLQPLWAKDNLAKSNKTGGWDMLVCGDIKVFANGVLIGNLSKILLSFGQKSNNIGIAMCHFVDNSVRSYYVERIENERFYLVERNDEENK